jgi:hypothetical protein
MKPHRTMSGSTATGATASLSKSASPVEGNGKKHTDTHHDTLLTAFHGVIPRNVSHLQVHRPVDLDEIYEHGNGDTSSDDDDDDDDEEGGEDACSTTFAFETPEKHRISALTQSLAEKQLGISQSFCSIVHKLSKLVLEANEAILEASSVSATESSSSFSSDGSSSTPIKPCSPIRQSRSTSRVALTRARKCKAMQDQAIAMAHKQARIAQQFETLVFRLEQEAIDREHTNAYLTRQVRMAKVLLQEEAGINLDEHSVGVYDDDLESDDKSTTTTFRLGEDRQALDDTACVSPSASMQSTSDLAFTIKEISFSNTVVDVSQMQQQRPPVATSSSQESPYSTVLRLLHPCVGLRLISLYKES